MRSECHAFGLILTTIYSAHWKYKTLALSFALLMCYMLFCAVMCAIAASKQGDRAYSIMIFSIIITYGGISLFTHFTSTYIENTHDDISAVYFCSSILSFDPWHMLTSFLPYMLLSPTYVNILNVFAFCNLDDVRPDPSKPFLSSHMSAHRFLGGPNNRLTSRHLISAL